MAKNSAINKDVDTLVDLSTAQTLENKTLTTPVIGDLTNATHNHTNNAGGGQITDAALSAAVGITKGGTGLSSAPTAGQLLIGKENGTYALAKLTDGNNITITEGDGAITIDAANGTLSWEEKTEAFTCAAGTGYIANGSTQVTCTLPASPDLGAMVRITGGTGAGGWKLLCPAGQVIHFGTADTTPGGHLSSNHKRDSVEVICVVSGASAQWNVVSAIGNITYV